MVYEVKQSSIVVSRQHTGCADIGDVRIAVDSSTLVSLAWAGQLELLGLAPIPLVVPEVIRQETVAEGLARGYADAAAIEQAVKALPRGIDPGKPGRGKRS